ncbi:MAG: TIGR02996 domain-containing protein [Planctomycetes bacterium]|nr:TIGR02996 domain-containing protein [Planctomycetota bacterium]
MSDRAALLAAICAHPDEDTPRLMYADWLDEHGQSKRAAYIRAKVAYYRASRDDSALAALYEFIATEYENRFERIDWSAPDADLGARRAARAVHDKLKFKMTDKSEGVPTVKGVRAAGDFRGFLDTLHVSGPAAFLRRAPALFAAAPFTGARFARLTAEQARDIAAAGHLARFRELIFDTDVEPEAIAVLGAHPDAAGVSELDVQVASTRDGTATAEALARGKHWTGLRALYFSGLGDIDARPDANVSADLFARPQFRGLHSLKAWGTGADDDTVRAIVRNMPELRVIDLALNPIGGRGAALIAAKKLPHLRALDLSSCEINDGKAVGAIVNSANLPALTVLRLDGNYFDGPAAKALTGAGRGPGLRVLKIGSAHFTPAGAAALGACPALRGLYYLSLEYSRLTADHFTGFLKRAALDRLTFLDLTGNDLGPTGAKALAAWPGASSLQWLDVSYCDLGISGAKALAESPHLGNLRHLHSSGPGAGALKARFKRAFV